jgi:hypothetical protein
MGWDGVTSRILMSRIRLSKAPYATDSETYEFTRQWGTVSPTQSLPTGDISLGHNLVLVYDSDRNREVLAYGSVPWEQPTEEGTWIWDGKRWTHIATAHPLPYMEYPSAAYSPDLHAVVMLDVGSSGPGKSPGDTLLFDGTDWRLVSPVHWPRWPAQLAYSRVRHAIVALSFADNRTWLFDGRDWSPTSAAGTASAARTASPPLGNGMETYSPSAAFDVKRDTWVLFGGFEGHADLAGTWTGDTSWTRRSSSNSPIARSGAGMMWDPSLAAVVLFGGFVGQYGQNPTDLSDTWSWDGSEWHQLAGPVYNGAPPAATPTA